jgi:inner membrane protein
MMGSSHRAVAVAAYGAMAVQQLLGRQWASAITVSVPGITEGVAAMAATLALVVAGSLLPDLDSPGSKASRSAGITSRLASRGFGALSKVLGGYSHRGPLHGLLGAFLVCAGAEALGLAMGGSGVGRALGFGWATHLLLDGMTRAGVPLFWPLRPLKSGVRIPPHVRSGGLGETVTVVSIIVALVAVTFVSIPQMHTLPSTIATTRVPGGPVIYDDPTGARK